MQTSSSRNLIAWCTSFAALSGCGYSPRSLQVAAGDGQTGSAGTSLASPLVVRVTDSSGAPVAGVGVDFAVAEGGGSLFARSVPTDARGEASVQWTLGTQAGAPQSARALLAGNNDGSVGFHATTVVGPFGKVAVEPANSSLWAGTTTQLSAFAQDQFGNLIGPIAASRAVWSSSDPMIASVSPTGLVRGVDLGSAMLTATVNGIAGSARIGLSEVLAGKGTPTIDGAMAPGEWDASPRLRFMMNVPGGKTPATLLVLYDATNLYLGLQFARSAMDPGNSFGVELDSNANGILDSGDDAIVYNPASGFYDDYRTTDPPCTGGALCGLTDVSVGGTSDGSGAFANNGVTSLYEVAHPLSSGDSHDISIAPGQFIGLVTSVRILDSSSAIYDTPFPRGSYLRVHIGQ